MASVLGGADGLFVRKKCQVQGVARLPQFLSRTQSRRAQIHLEKTSNPEWNQVFLISKDQIHSPCVEISVKDRSRSGDGLIGMIVLDDNDVPRRVSPDSPLAPEWYRLENRRGETVDGKLMFAIWMGTQADEAFPELGIWTPPLLMAMASPELGRRFTYLLAFSILE